MSRISKDYVSDIIDEIALEGLDGITLEALWVRLTERPGFIFKPKDDFVKEFIWKVVSRLSNVSFYTLPTERKPLIAYKRSEHVDSCGNFYEPEDLPPCIYPHCPIEDKGIMGSCSTYKERINVTYIVREEDYRTVYSRGNFLVIVADQRARSKAICCYEFNPVTELGVIQYCILERIARSRYEGEVTQGKRGLQVVTDDPKMLYYFRKLLLKNKLVQKQVFYMKVSKQTSTGSLIHLPRFYSEIKHRDNTGALKLINYLQDAPMKCIAFRTLKTMLNIELKKLLMKYPKNFKTTNVPYRVMNPSCKPSEWKLKSTGEEKSVRVVKLLNPNLSKDDEEEDDDEEEVGLMDESRRRMDRSLMRQAYSIVEQAGPRGIKQGALGCLLAVPSLQARSICKHLVRKQLVRTVLIDVGRQRISHFYCTKFDSAASSLNTEMKEERNKLLQAITKNTELCDESTTHDNLNNTGPAICADDEVTPNEKVNQKEPSVSPLKKKKKNTTEDPEIASEKNNHNSGNKNATNPQDDIEAEIIINKTETSADFRSLLTLTEEENTFENSDSYNLLTARMLKRASLIVQAVNLHKVIQDTQKVQRMISEVEEAEGLKQSIDRKTIQRLLDKLESDGLLRTIKVNLKGYGKEKSMLFICHPSVNETHSEIQSAIEQAKMKLPIVSAHHSKKKKNQDSKKTKQPALKYEPKAGRKYGFKPKFVRMRILHNYMFYLIYGYDGDANLDQTCKKEIIDKTEVDPSFLEEMPFVYRTEIDWKMFLPPLPVHAEYPAGWCLLSDVLLRLPLCLFVSIVNVSHCIPGLSEYLEHPLKKFYLVKCMPPEILHNLTIYRRYIFVISEIVSRLGFIGLIQMGPQKLKEKDQVFIYLNKNAMLYNTIPSDVGYYHISKNKNYECVQYQFNTAEDVEHYWYDLWNFAMNTNLGNRNSMTGQPIVVESVNTKKELLAAIQPKTIEETKACDVGYIPGDNLGAGGLDSDMFVHLKRNWSWPGEKLEGLPGQKELFCPPPVKRTKLQKENISTRNAPSLHQTTKPSKFKDKDGVKHVSDVSKSKISKVGSWKSRAVSKKKTRVLMQRKTKFARKPYYDQKDKDALSRMVKLRVDWSPIEDNLLLICKVASLYMSSDKRRQVTKNFCAVREILHATYPAISRNKTSRACQRRMHYMMKNQSTAHSVYLCLEEIKQDSEITEKFDRAVDKLDALLKAQGEGPKGYQEEYDKIFMNLVTTLLKKLKTITSNENALNEIQLPRTVAEFENKYEIVVPKPLIVRNESFKEVTKTIDILAAVINAVIHSSLCCANDKTSYSHQLFYIYQQYPDKLLRYVMAKCRSMSIVSCRKRYKRWKSAGNDCLPLASSPYQLSITYVYALQTKYQYSIFSDCFNGLKRLLRILNSSQGKNNELPPVKSPIEIEVTSGGECANIVELFSAGLVEIHVEFPEQLIVLDPRLSETEESYKMIMKRFKELLAVINDTRKKEKKATHSEDEEDDDDFPVDKSLCEEKETHFDQFNLKNKTGVANTASRLALYLMRDEPLEQLDKSLQHAHDFFVLNPCKVSVDVIAQKAEDTIFFKEKKLDVIAEIKRLAVFPGDNKDNASVVKMSDKYSKEFTLPLLDYLESKGELGATYNNLIERFENVNELREQLFSLVDEQIILRSGLINVRYIHSKFSKPWLVKSFYLLRLVRDNIEAQSTNSAYAISFGGTDPSSKKKGRKSKIPVEDVKNDTNESDACSPPSKKSKVSSNLETNEKNEPLPSTSAEGGSGNVDDSCTVVHETSEDNSPPIKKRRLGSRRTADRVDPSSENSAKAKSPEKEQSRFLMKSTNKRWIAIPNENMKKFTNLDGMETKNVFVKVRPWIKIDGTLNRRVLDRLLGSVLGHCLTCPGILVKKLQERFVPALQPVHTFELLEILVEIECVKLIVIKKSWKCSLFSKRVDISTEPSNGFGNTADMAVDPDPLAISRLGYFIGDKNYTIDYLEALTGTKID